MASPNPEEWDLHRLLICVSSGRDTYSFISLYCSQETFVARMPGLVGVNLPAIVNVERLSEATFEALEGPYRAANRIVEE